MFNYRFVYSYVFHGKYSTTCPLRNEIQVYQEMIKKAQKERKESNVTIQLKQESNKSDGRIY